MEAEAALLECRDLACGYSGKEVLSGLGLTLMQGGITALLGPNGSGKSTLLKTVSKTLPPIRGEVRLLGAPLERMSFRMMAQAAAFVPQEEEPRFSFLVREVVTMGRLPHSTGIFDTDEDRAAAEAAMVLAGCSDLADRPITELSGGERQRVLIARALAQRPRVLLLDEPSSHLDVGHQLALIRLLKDFAEAGNSILIAVHDLNLAAILAKDALLLDRGRVAASGSIEEVLLGSALEEVYGVRFARQRAEDGRLLVHPVLA